MVSNTVIQYTSALTKTQKQILSKPDENGYYNIVIGGLNVFNSVGEYYTLNGAKKFFERNSVLMRRVKRGLLRGELGHPKRMPKETLSQFISRLPYIDEKNVCVHYKDIYLERTGSEKDPVIIKANLKPSGPYGNVLKESLENEDENVAFSIRSITNNALVNGVVIKNVVSIYTWDYVNEPGISKATQWNEVGLETIKFKNNKIGIVDLDDKIIKLEDLREAIKETKNISNEAHDELVNLYNFIKKNNNLPNFKEWLK